MSDDNELKDDDIVKEGDLKKTNTGSMFALYVECAVLVVYPTINHPAKITQVLTNEAEICYDVCESVSQMTYTRLILVLDMTFLMRIKGNMTDSVTSWTVIIHS